MHGPPAFLALAFAVALGVLFAISTAAALAIAAVFVPVAAATATVVAGIARRPAPWPWIVGLGLAFVPACWMASVRLCDAIAGACVAGAELNNSRLAIVSVIAFVAAAMLLAVRRSRVRDAAFALLVLFGQAWLLLRLAEAGETAAAVLVALLVVLELGYEVAARTRFRAHDAAAA